MELWLFNKKLENGKIIKKGKAIDLWHKVHNDVGFIVNDYKTENKYERISFNDAFNIANSNKNKWVALFPEEGAGNTRDSVANYLEKGGDYYFLQFK